MTINFDHHADGTIHHSQASSMLTRLRISLKSFASKLIKFIKIYQIISSI